MHIYINAKLAKLFILFTIIFILVVLVIAQLNSLVLNIYPTDNSRNEHQFQIVYKLNNKHHQLIADSNRLAFNGTNWLYLVKTVEFFNYKGNSSLVLNSNKTINIEHLRKIIMIPLPYPINVSIINNTRNDKLHDANNTNSGIGLLVIVYYSSILAVSITIFLSLCYVFFYFLFSLFINIVNKMISQFILKIGEPQNADNLSNSVIYTNVGTSKEFKNQKRYFYYGLFLLILSVFLLSFNYLYYTEFKSIFYNSDELFFPNVISDLWHGGSIFNWNLSLSTFLFPDYIIFCLAYLVTSNIYFMFLIYFIIQFTLFFGLIALLFASFFNKIKSIYFAGWVSFIIAILAILPFSETAVYRIPLLGGFHFGAFLVVLMLLNFMLRVVTSNQHKYQTHYSYIVKTSCSVCLIFITNALGVLSDAFVIIWFLVPSIITLTSLYILREKKLKLLIIYLLTSIVGSLFGLIFLKYFHINSRGGAHLIPLNSGAILKQIFLAGFFINSFWVLSIIFTLFWIMILISIIIIFRNHKFVNNQYVRGYHFLKSLKFIFLFYLLSVVIILLAEFFAQNLGFADRYMLPSFIFPIMIAVPVLCNILKGYQLIALLVIMLAIPATQIKNAKFSLNGYYPEDVECVDQALAPYRLSNGIAQYWDARFYSLLSKNNLKIYSVDGSTLKQFYPLSPTKIPNSFDFAIINTRPSDSLPAYALNESLIYEINGRPRLRLTSCKNRVILIYKKGGIKLGM